MTIAQYFPAFEKMLLESDRRPRTVYGYVKDLKTFENWFKETHHVSPALIDITPLDVHDYREYLQHQRKLSPATINRRLTSLRVFLDFAIDKGWLIKNPATKTHSLKRVPHVPRWLTPVEQSKLRRTLDREIRLARTDRAILLLLLNTGLRSIEMMQLTLDDIDLSEQRGSVFVRDGKGRKSRYVPLNYEARQALQDYLEVRPALETDRLFVGSRGPLKQYQLQRSLKKYCRLAEIDVSLVTAYTLRHTCGKNLVDAGVSLDKVATLLGHASLNNIRIYTNPTPDEHDIRRAEIHSVKKLTVEEREYLETQHDIMRKHIFLMVTILAVYIVTWVIYTAMHAFAPDILISTFGSEELAKLFYDRASFVVISLIIIPTNKFLLSSFFRELVDEIREQKTIVKAVWTNIRHDRSIIVLLIALGSWIYLGIHLFFH